MLLISSHTPALSKGLISTRRCLFGQKLEGSNFCPNTMTYLKSSTNLTRIFYELTINKIKIFTVNTFDNKRGCPLNSLFTNIKQNRASISSNLDKIRNHILHLLPFPGQKDPLL